MYYVVLPKLWPLLPIGLCLITPWWFWRAAAGKLVSAIIVPIALTMICVGVHALTLGLPRFNWTRDMHDHEPLNMPVLILTVFGVLVLAKTWKWHGKRQRFLGAIFFVLATIFGLPTMIQGFWELWNSLIEKPASTLLYTIPITMSLLIVFATDTSGKREPSYSSKETTVIRRR